MTGDMIRRIEEKAEDFWRVLRGHEPEPDRQSVLEGQAAILHRYGITREAVRRIGLVLGRLEDATADELRTDPMLRRHVRYLCALMPVDFQPSRLPATILWLISKGDELTIEHVREILAGHGGEHSGQVVWLISAELRKRGPRSQAAVARDLGVDVDVVAGIEQWMQLPEAKELDLREQAGQAVRDGLSTRQFAEQAGLGRTAAKRYMDEARGDGHVETGMLDLLADDGIWS